MRTESATELTPVDYHMRPDGTAEVRLHRDIEHASGGGSEDGTAPDSWSAEERAIETTLTEAEVEGRFDELWEQAGRDAMTDRELIAGLAERVGEGELTIDELAEGLIELAGMIGGE